MNNKKEKNINYRETTGKVTEMDMDMRKDVLCYIIYIVYSLFDVHARYKFRSSFGDELYYVPVYSAIVSYEVDNQKYTLYLNDYSRVKPIIGRKARVFYDPECPKKAYVDVKRKYKKPMRVFKVDEEWVYCKVNMFKKIQIPVELADERAVEGAYLIEKYGRYPMREPGDMRKNMIQRMMGAKIETVGDIENR